jgi:hypothetical protein
VFDPLLSVVGICLITALSRLVRTHTHTHTYVRTYIRHTSESDIFLWDHLKERERDQPSFYFLWLSSVPQDSYWAGTMIKPQLLPYISFPII